MFECKANGAEGGRGFFPGGFCIRAHPFCRGYNQQFQSQRSFLFGNPALRVLDLFNYRGNAPLKPTSPFWSCPSIFPRFRALRLEANAGGPRRVVFSFLTPWVSGLALLSEQIILGVDEWLKLLENPLRKMSFFLQHQDWTSWNPFGLSGFWCLPEVRWRDRKGAEWNEWVRSEWSLAGYACLKQACLLCVKSSRVLIACKPTICRVS